MVPDRERLTPELARGISDDAALPFQVDPYALRGRLVRLGPAVDRILTAHDYPQPVGQMLGEALALAACLADSLKFDGIFTLQTRGDGPISTLVADVTSAGDLRGYAGFDAERLAAAEAKAEPSGGLARSVPKLLGAGHIAFTVDQGEATDRYQGIVELEGATLADCTHAYFQRSEQIGTGIMLAAGQVEGEEGRPAWRAGALMIQKVPYEGGEGLRPPPAPNAEAYDDGWRRALGLMGTTTTAELLDRALPPDRLLYRLFHEDGVRVYKSHPLRAQCRCSDERVERVLRGIGREELETLKVDGEVVVTCEFCKTTRRYDDAALDRVLAG